jgi:ABC-2 type transport system permease protein
MEALSGGLKEMLDSYGIAVGDSMVLDPQNEPFPVQVQRQVGDMSVIEVSELSYPYFVDVRADGMDRTSPIVSKLPAVTMHWSSPLTLDEAKNQGREVSVLLQSTDKAWLRSSTDVQPNAEQYPPYGFPVEGEQQAYPLAVSVRGAFDSYFKDRPSPMQATEPLTGTVEAEPPSADLGTVQRSPDSARLVVIGSNEFIDDAVLDISSRLSADRYLNNLQFMQNAVDWAVEDEDLLGIRSRGTYARLLAPLERRQQSTWEIANYVLALSALLVIGGVWAWRRRQERPISLVAAVAEDEPGQATGAGSAKTPREPEEGSR